MDNVRNTARHGPVKQRKRSKIDKHQLVERSSNGPDTSGSKMAEGEGRRDAPEVRRGRTKERKEAMQVRRDKEGLLQGQEMQGFSQWRGHGEPDVHYV